MKNKNIKNKPKNVVGCFSCLLDLSKCSGGGPPDPPPLIKGLHQLNPQNLSSTTTALAAEGKKKKKKPGQDPTPPTPLAPAFKQSSRNLVLGYSEIEKGGRRWGKIFFVWFVIGLFETLICAIAEDKVCDSCIVSSLSIAYLFTFSVMTKFKFPVLCDYAKWRI